MSRIGKQPITVPANVKVSVDDDLFTAEGPKGKVSERVLPGISVAIDAGVIRVERSDDTQQSRAQHGLIRSLLANAVHGVTEGFSKSLDIVGVGYRAEMKGRDLHLALGFSHPVVYPVPPETEVVVDKNNRMSVSGANRQKVGQVAAEIRALRPPDAYKGKGIRYSDEALRLKVGKAGGAA